MISLHEFVWKWSSIQELDVIKKTYLGVQSQLEMAIYIYTPMIRRILAVICCRFFCHFFLSFQFDRQNWMDKKWQTHDKQTTNKNNKTTISSISSVWLRFFSKPMIIEIISQLMEVITRTMTPFDASWCCRGCEPKSENDLEMVGQTHSYLSYNKVPSGNLT